MGHAAGRDYQRVVRAALRLVRGACMRMNYSLRKLAGIFLILFLPSACAENNTAIIVGVSKFCIPQSQKVADVSYVATEMPAAENAFAFAGCWRPGGISPKDCPLPSSVRGGVVSSENAFGPARWADLANDPQSLYRKIYDDPSTSVESAEDGKNLVIENQRRWKEWFVWRKAERGAALQLKDDDQLLVSCGVIENTYVPTDKSGRRMISCRRVVVGDGYSAQYTFESAERTPRDIESLDAAVVKTIDSWRCK